ncbi:MULTISPECIES: hypothetical protein [unclassified Paenibacillus]|uniref:hypothetical protein n=1 Tax=unclassified Paenibacillus TaxID=185978 RepID=UPI000CFD7F8F|nr:MULTISPECIES: hypothetical protein [unclassified Paenibacillus]PRA02555.1 hypothetical protein CQ043_20900 [Paenibacillus sp. MYb63]PRA45361.1 hypothetical protein CQ061_20860 [Paenibacillus sp. MYb67]QZN78267.1 hypothetical protein K5K90_14390 [Paenibacillus sp. DR312]
MADVLKKMYGGVVPTAITDLYKAPPGKRAVLKSLILCNQTSSDQLFWIELGGYYFVHMQTIKANDTLVIPVFDQVLAAGTNIRIWSQNANSIVARLSGYETDRMDLISVRANLTATDTTILSNTATLLIKSIVICCRTTDPVKLNLLFGSDYIISNRALGKLETLLVPVADQFFPAGEVIKSGAPGVTGSANVVVHINAMVVT